MNPEILKRLWERRMTVVNDLQAQAFVTEGREATAEEKQADERMSSELVSLDEKIAKGMDDLEREQRASDAMDRYARLTHGQAQPVDPSNERGAAKAAELRDFLAGERRSVEFEIDSRVRDHYNLESRAWDPDVWERRDLLETTANMPLPKSFSGQLYEAFVDAVGVIKAKVGNDTLFITSTGETLTVPRALTHGAAAWTAEGAGIAENDPALTGVDLSAWKAGQLVQVSYELVNDQGFDIVGYVGRAAGRNCGLLAGAGYVVGDGASKPTGFQPNATVSVTGPTGTSTSLGTQATAGQGSDLLVDLAYSVLEPYADNGVWLMNRTSVAKVARLKGTNGEVIWMPGLAPGAPDTLLGRPIITDPNMPVMAANAKSIAFGDFNGYAVRIVRGVRFERSDDYAFNADLITFKAVLRTDGKLLDTGAVKLFQNSAT